MKCVFMDLKASNAIFSSSGIIILIVAALVAIAAITAVFIWRKRKNKKTMNLLFTLLDGASLGPMLAIGFLFIILPVAALILLIWLFRRRKRKNE